MRVSNDEKIFWNCFYNFIHSCRSMHYNTFAQSVMSERIISLDFTKAKDPLTQCLKNVLEQAEPMKD